MSRLALPAALQQFFFAAGMTLFFRIVGTIGIAQLAAANVLLNLLLVAILPGMGFGFACASLVGQALGRKEIADAKQWGWEVSRLAAVIVGSLGFAAFVFPEFFLSGFLKNSSTVALARLPLQLTALTISLDTVGLVLLQALLGAGDSRRVMLVATGLQWLLFLPAAYMLGPVFGFGLLAVWVAQLAYRGIQSVVFLVMWQRGKWTEIKV